MAQTKTKPKAKKTSKPKSKSRASSKSASKGKAAKSNGGAKVSSKKSPASSNGGGVLDKAKVPLVAGGAALAGIVGGAALGAKRSGSKVLGVPMPKAKRVQFRTKDLRKAAKDVGGFGENVGDLVTELRNAQDAVANGKGTSPVEILLQGLTKRR